MEKLLVGFLATFIGYGVSTCVETKYKRISQLPSSSIVRKKCEAIDQEWGLVRDLHKCACDNLEEILKEVDIVAVEAADAYKPINIVSAWWYSKPIAEEINNKLKDIQERALIPGLLILAGSSIKDIEQEQKMAEEYVRKTFDEAYKNSSWF